MTKGPALGYDAPLRGVPLIELGPFDLLKPIARGGMGMVWTARHRRLQTPVAVKFLMIKAMRNPRFIQAFRNEVRAVAALNARGIVAVHDYGEATAETERLTQGGIAAGTPWLAMELVRGGTLISLCGRLSWAEVESVILNLLEALAHAHARGVIHRDLKPGNVLVHRSAAGISVKLTDFGLAHAVQGVDMPEGQSFSGGTPSYMAPEQFRGQWRDFGPWTDLYACGCLFWTLLTGKPPFNKKLTMDEKKHLHLTRPPPEFRPAIGVPDGFEAWLRVLLEKKPSHRFACAADALAALRKLGPSTDDSVPSRPDDVPDSDDDTVVLGDQPTQVEEDLLPELELDLDAATDTEIRAAARRHQAPTIPRSWRALGSDPSVEPMGLGLIGLREVPLVGRVAHRDALWSALVRTHDKQRVHVAALVGPAGTGKTRLAEWLSERAHEFGAAVTLKALHRSIPGLSHGLAPMIKAYLRCQGLKRPAVRTRVAAALRAVGVSHVDEWEALTEVISPAPNASRKIRFATPTERWVTIRRWLQGLAADRPLILFLDDVHYGLDSLRFVSYLMGYDSPKPLPILVVLTATDSILADRLDEATALNELMDQGRSSVIPVSPLPPKYRSDLVRGILGLEGELASRVEDRTAGNPQFAVELVGDWVRRGLLELGEDGFQRASAVSEKLPDSAIAMWAARMARFAGERSPAERHALEIAAVLGGEIAPAEWVEACLRSDAEADPSDGLIEALLQERLAEHGHGGPEAGWCFADENMRRVVKELAKRGKRSSKWHRVCAEVLEDQLALRPGQLGLRQRIGRHWMGAGELERAVPRLLEGAREHQSAADYEAAVRLLSLRDEALAALRVPPRDDRWGTGWVQRFEIASQRAHYDEMEQWLGRTERSASEHNWPEIGAVVKVFRSNRSRIQGRYSEALEWLRQVEELAANTGNRALLARTRREIGEVHIEKGDIAGGSRWMELALLDYEKLHDTAGCALCWRALGEAAKEGGEHNKAARLLQRSEEAFDALGNRFFLAATINSQGDLARYHGNYERAEDCYRRSRGLLRAVGSEVWVFPQYNSALVQIAKGEYARARPLIEEASAVFTKSGNRHALAHAHLALARCAASDDQWLMWDEEIREAAGHLDSTGFADEDTARFAMDAAADAQGAGHLDRALRAYGLARRLWQKLKRSEETRRTDELLSRLERRGR